MTQSAAARAARVLVIGAALAVGLVTPAGALAGGPDTTPAANIPYDFAAGTVCADAMHFENANLRGITSLFGAAPNGSIRLLSRGSGVSFVVDTDNGKRFDWRGGSRFLITFAADGSVRVDGDGNDVVAWYFPGDVSDLGPGLFQTSGHVTEWYDANFTFLRATFTGTAINLCERLAG